MAIITGNFNEGCLTLHAHGRIDSSNAADASNEIFALYDESEVSSLVLDLEDLEYISSAGLRVVLKLRKSCPLLSVINASTEIYDIFDKTGFTEMMSVSKAFRKLSVEGCEIIGKGAKGTVYRWKPDTVVKVYNNSDALPNIKKESVLARKALVLGIPTAISLDVVKVGDKYGSVFELLDAKSYSQLIAENPDRMSEYVDKYTELLLQIHNTPVQPSDMPDVRIRVKSWISEDTGFLSSETVDKLNSLIDALPERHTMLHVDYHTNNLLMQNGETLLIDMDTLSYGHPVFELATIYTAYVGFGEADPTIVENFIGLPYETCCRFWKEFLFRYLGTDDEEKAKETEEKVRLLSYVRQLRHSSSRSYNNADETNLCVSMITKLSQKINTLEF